MKELLDGFSVERLESFINQPLNNGLTRGEQMALARIALAVKQAQPITVEILDKDIDAVKAAFAKGMDRYSGAMLELAGREDNPALQNFRAAMEGIGHIRRTLEETFGGLHGTHVEPDVLVECKAICDAIFEAYRKTAAQEVGD